MKTKRLLPPTYLFVSIVWMAVLYWISPFPRIVSFPWNLLGAVPLALGIVLNLAADQALKKHGTTVKPFEASTALITTGVYGISRHPMYLGMVMILFGIALIMGCATPFFVIVVFGILMDRIFVKAEERMLEDTFGGDWPAYKKRVRRWI